MIVTVRIHSGHSRAAPAFSYASLRFAAPRLRRDFTTAACAKADAASDLLRFEACPSPSVLPASSAMCFEVCLRFFITLSSQTTGKSTVGWVAVTVAAGAGGKSPPTAGFSVARVFLARLDRAKTVA